MEVIDQEAMMEFHECANLFPLMQGVEFENLCANIEEYGLLHPIVLHDHQILDGRNRYKACMLVGVEPRYEEWAGECVTPLQYCISANKERRHLNSDQLACIALKALPYFEAEAVERKQILGKEARNKQLGVAQNFDRPQKSGRASEVVATIFDTNYDYVQKAKYVQQKEPELLDQVMSGKVKLYKAYNECKRREEETISRNYKISLNGDDKNHVWKPIVKKMVFSTIKEVNGDTVTYDEFDDYVDGEYPVEYTPTDFLKSDLCKEYCEFADLNYTLVRAWVDMGCPNPRLDELLCDVLDKQNRNGNRRKVVSKYEILSLDEMADNESKEEQAYVMEGDADRF